MRFPDHRIAADPAEIVGDLAGGRSAGPHGLEALDALVGPGHVRQFSNACGAPRLQIGDSPMINQSPTNPTEPWVRATPGEPTLHGVNWEGLKTLYIKEVRRFFKVHMQTVWAPAITTLLYLVIFTVALGREGRTILGVHSPISWPRADHDGDAAEQLRHASFSLMSANAGTSSIPDAAPVDRRADHGLVGVGGDPRVPGRRGGLAGDVAMARGSRRGRSSLWALISGWRGRCLAPGGDHPIWRQVRPSGDGHQLRGDAMSYCRATFYSVEQLSPHPGR